MTKTIIISEIKIKIEKKIKKDRTEWKLIQQEIPA